MLIELTHLIIIANSDSNLQFTNTLCINDMLDYIYINFIIL